MKKIFTLIFSFIVTCLISISFVHADDFSSEKIISFSSDIAVQKDGVTQVKETIVYDFGDKEKHGIFRTIPIGFKAMGQPDHISLKVQSVTDEHNVPYTYTITSNDPLNVRVGDPQKTITGQHTYVINYEVESLISFFENYDELYWNITGDAWEIPINKVNVRITLPSKVTRDVLQTSEYCGMSGEKKSCGQMIINENGEILYTTEDGLIIDPGNQVTLAVGFTQGLVKSPTRADFILSFIKKTWFIPFPFIISVFWYRKRLKYWWTRRSYYKRTTIIPEYDAGDFNPLEAALIVNGKAVSKDITALIVFLAIRKCLTIENKDDEFYFKKIKYFSSEKGGYENVLLDALDDKKESSLASYFGKKATEGITSAKASLVARDYVYANVNKQSKNGMITFIAFFFAINPGIFVWLLCGVGLGFIFSGICLIVGVVSALGGVRDLYLSEKGFEAERKLLGLKLYINLAEKERIAFANAPAKTPELFEKLLPYAIIFGLEKKWAKEFEDIYTDEPAWYAGTTNHFSPLLFTSSLCSVSTAASLAIAASVPKSSSFSSSSSSGSSRSGFSGGGGGGGGGGSW